MAHGNALYLATLISGRYANREHTAAILKTDEFGNVACSEADFPYLWERRDEIEMTLFKASENREVDGPRHVPPMPSDEPTMTGVIALPAQPPPPDAIEDVPEVPAPVVGDWREAIKNIMSDEPMGPAEDFGIGMELEPEPIFEGEPVEFVPPPVPRTIVVSERKTGTDETWGKAQIRYEVAIKAKNGSALAKGLLMTAAERRGVSVEELADEILRQHEELVQRVMSEF